MFLCLVLSLLPYRTCPVRKKELRQKSHNIFYSDWLKKMARNSICLSISNQKIKATHKAEKICILLLGTILSYRTITVGTHYDL